MIYSLLNRPTSIGLKCPIGEKRTQDHFEPESNIKNIMSRYKKSGVLPMELLNPKPPVYGDSTQAPDFMTAQTILLQAEAAYNALPNKIHDRFKSAIDFIEFCEKKENIPEAIKLGILKKRPKKEEEPSRDDINLAIKMAKRQPVILENRAKGPKEEPTPT